ncbi:MAG: helix-hairpin-helix domain-containing protein, partial [Proteobacteria bacterium]|nr:helix-hairpin-helix domain-containing protein [Pseudomonadota bacterium]
EGPFAAPEDLMKVKGIGEKAYEANKEKIVVK